MFQNFDDPSDADRSAARIAELRTVFDRLGIDGFLVPRADEFQGEYVPECAERLRWLTGFTGSAGMALILREEALIFVDGRYTLQVRAQTDGSVFRYADLIEMPPPKWLEENAPAGLRLGFDPWLHTIAEAKKLREALSQGELVPVEENPVDTIWRDRPAPPLGKVKLHPVRFAGVEAREKLAELSDALRKKELTHFVLSDPSSLAWAFNIRGNDVPHTPLALGYALLCAEGDHVLFMAPEKFDEETKAGLSELCRIAPPESLTAELFELAAGNAQIGLDPAGASERLKMIAGSAGQEVDDPVALRRAVKNEAEIEGARRAHHRDGIAVTRFLCWLDQQPPGQVDEIAAALKLEELRHKTGEQSGMPLQDISFDTISGAGPNGAVIHYRVTRATNRVLEPGSLYLNDSGAQYCDGTTDITRTVAVGMPTEEMQRHYTIVLKGLIAISMLRFPQRVRGMDIDAIARIAHWKAGIDYAHGTGHGVGSFLSVHEGPQRISHAGTQRLLPGMILSNEPGYYREGHYGIRLENLILVTGAEAVPGGELPMLGFETLTLAPFDNRLILPGMLTVEERDWLEQYHQRVMRELGPSLDSEERNWLALRCRLGG